MRAVAKGAVNPYRTRFTDTASEVAERLQPNSSSNGTIRTPTEDRNAADASRTRKVTPATSHARWMRVAMLEP
jgi:hypothetical protein